MGDIQHRGAGGGRCHLVIMAMNGKTHRQESKLNLKIIFIHEFSCLSFGKNTLTVYSNTNYFLLINSNVRYVYGLKTAAIYHVDYELLLPMQSLMICDTKWSVFNVFSGYN